MKRCQIDCDLIQNFDLFGKQPEFFYKGKSQRVSWFGRIFSVFYIVLYVAFVIYKLVRMLKKVDIDFYETYAFSGIPSIKLNNDLFYGGFTIGGLIDETLYFPVVYHYTETLPCDHSGPVGRWRRPRVQYRATLRPDILG